MCLQRKYDQHILFIHITLSYIRYVRRLDMPCMSQGMFTPPGAPSATSHLDVLHLRSVPVSGKSS